MCPLTYNSVHGEKRGRDNNEKKLLEAQIRIDPQTP